MSTINNTLTADDEFSGLALSAEMPYTSMSNAYKKNISPIIKGTGVLLGMWGLAYVGNKAIDYFKDKLNNVPVEDPNKDIAWDY